MLDSSTQSEVLLASEGRAAETEILEGFGTPDT